MAYSIQSTEMVVRIANKAPRMNSDIHVAIGTAEPAATGVGRMFGYIEGWSDLARLRRRHQKTTLNKASKRMLPAAMPAMAPVLRPDAVIDEREITTWSRAK
jgi:hypothetical protein